MSQMDNRVVYQNTRNNLGTRLVHQYYALATGIYGRYHSEASGGHRNRNSKPTANCPCGSMCNDLMTTNETLL